MIVSWFLKRTNEETTINFINSLKIPSPIDSETNVCLTADLIAGSLLKYTPVRNPRKWLFGSLVAAQFVLALLVLKNWLYAGTYRLYVEDRVAPSPEDGMMWQQFNVLDKRVVPQIFTEGTALMRFPVRFRSASALLVTATSTDEADYEVNLFEAGSRRLLHRRRIEGQKVDRILLPGGSGVLEISSHGSVVWSDLRVVHGGPIMPYLAAFIIALAASLMLLRTDKGRSLPDPRGRRKILLFIGASIVGSCLLALFLIEGAMYVFGAPAAIRSLRRELGEVSPDPQWEDSVEYGSRLRRNQNTLLHWRDGDIVRMGYIPPPKISNGPGLYPLQTDGEGFRNPRVREAVQVAALGDSFTDALTLPVDRIWTSRLEQNLRAPVQNYGTAGFGPQQELLVLRQYAIKHRPRVVLLAFFAGNDIFDAEAFDKYERAGGSISLSKTGWSIQKIVARYETFYLFSLARLVFNSVKTEAANRAMDGPKIVDAVARTGEAPGVHATGASGFDRGMFTIPVNDRMLQFALMPPYLQTLRLSEAEIEKRLGWQLTRKTILDMNRVSHDGGATLVVLFIPFKSQVYFPLLVRSFATADLERYFQFYFRQNPTQLDAKEMFQNRLAQNDLMRQLCDSEHIPLIDVTAALQTEVESGKNVYFPDESHWNDDGHAVAAREIAAFLKRHGLDQNRE